MQRKAGKALSSVFLTLILAISFAVLGGYLKSAYASGSSWSTPCGFGNNRGTSYLSTPCSSSYNCCIQGTTPAVKPARVVKTPPKIVKPAAPKKHVSTYDISAHDIYFALNSSALSYKSISILKRDATYLKNNPSVVVQIQGNCDKRGSVQYNMALASRRVNAAKAYLERLGIGAGRLETAVFGKSRPVCNSNTSACYAMNRSDHFAVVSK
ncbi:MAG: OmpA family protein [Deltaproteobacteria bacterium]|nr:OmpA family protein [Deltaproteobacteria bacterium]